MKKKILFTILCLLSLTYMNGVSARECTPNDIDSARATLSIQEAYRGIPIPSLGRTASTSKTNLYKMILTHNSSGQSVNSFCLASSKPASTGLVYKIEDDITSPTWRKIYQYGIENKNDEIKYIIAQAAYWLQLEGKSLNNQNLEEVAYDIILNKNCESYFINGGESSKDASDICNSYKNQDNSTSLIKSKLISIYSSKGGIASINEILNTLQNDIRSTVNDFQSYSGIYNDKLYYWVEVNGSQEYQPMVAPLICGDNNYSCTDQNGNVHDYTNEYNDCLTKGGEPFACRTNLENTYCSNNSAGVIKFQEKYAACNNNFVNYGYFKEVVDTTVSGNAIPGKGEPEKLITQYCNLFCLENEAQQIFPGNVKPAVSVGTYIIWPTSEATLSSKYKNQYPLKFSGEKTCYVVMAGEDNTVNKMDINGVLSGKQTEVNKLNIRDRKFAGGQYYETSRLNGGCDNAYNDITGFCRSSYNDMNEAYAKLKEYENSQKYQNYLREKQQIEGQNKEICEHAVPSNHLPDGWSCKGNFCSEYAQYCKGNNPKQPDCKILEEQCDEQNKCGKLSPASQEALSEFNTINATYEGKVSVYNECQTQKNACNTYTQKVQEIVNFANKVKTCATYTPSCSGGGCEIYNFETNVDLSWTDSEYGTEIKDSQLEKTKNYSSSISGERNVSTQVDMSQSLTNIITNTNYLINEVSEIVNERKIVANVNVTYSLPTKGKLLYNYVVKRNNRFVSQTEKPNSSSNNNYVTIGYSNLPISFDAKTNQDYKLILSDIRFGDNGGQYKQDIYTCNYKVTKTPDSDCLCPVGTKHEGKDLSSFIIDKGLTCYDAQKAFCDYEPQACPDGSKQSEMTSCLTNEYPGDYFTCYDKYCRSGDKDKYCPNKPEIKLTTCLNNYSYDYCYNLLCTSNVGSEYKCKNTNGVDGEMDITSCVYTKMAQGLSLNDAINECDALICPLSGLRIIYRTISLENPFPGKNISNMVNGFNDDVKGRYPGANWNDVKLVNNHILTVKRHGITYDGSAIYQGEPLYTFVLTTSTINAIRNYNDQQELNGGYADYTLDCKLNNSRACVSKFVHNPDLSGLVNGVCMNSTSRSNFYVCSGDN